MKFQSESIPRGNERILLVDDDETLLISARNMLERFGYKVTALTDGEEALKVFSEKPSDFDLVITDHLMPLADQIGGKGNILKLSCFCRLL